MIFHVINVLALSALIILIFDKIINTDFDKGYRLIDILNAFWEICVVVAATAFFYALICYYIKHL